MSRGICQLSQLVPGEEKPEMLTIPERPSLYHKSKSYLAPNAHNGEIRNSRYFTFHLKVPLPGRPPLVL